MMFIPIRARRAIASGLVRRAAQVSGIVPLVAAVLALSPALAQASSRTWYVAPAGAATSCASDTASTPLATIQAAIACASNGDVIVLAPSGSTPYPGIGAVGKNVTIKAIKGADARTVAVDVAGPVDAHGLTSGPMSVPAGVSANLQGITVECSGGHLCLSSDDGSGSLITNSGTLNLTGVYVTGAQQGAAIRNLSTGAGPARLTVVASTIAGNTDTGQGGHPGRAAGISSDSTTSGVGPQLTVANSTIANNSNTYSAGAGGIYTGASDGQVTLIGDTITGNSGPDAGGVFDATSNSGATAIRMSNTIVAANTAHGAPKDCSGQVADGPGGHNLLGSTTGCSGLTNGTDGDLVAVSDPGLNALGFNGGSTQTVSLQPQSPAIAAADQAICQASPIDGHDQRGAYRGVTARGCDIGAYDTTGHLGTANATWYVGPGGTASSCPTDSSSTPFATIQAALACASNGDVISVASSSSPYPGIGTISHGVTIKGASARKVAVDVSAPADGSILTSGLMSVQAGVSARLQGITVECSAGHACLSSATGSLITNSGTLNLTGVYVTGAKQGAAIRNLSTGSEPARLTVLGSTVAGNTDGGLGHDQGHAGAISSGSDGAVQPQLLVANSTIANNTDADGVGAGGIYTDASQDGAVTLIGDTITGNSGPNASGVEDLVGAGSSETPIRMSNTIVAANTANGAPKDCSGQLADGPGGHNLLGNDTGCAGLTNGTDGDLVNVSDPGLNALAFNTGPTQTMSLKAGSPAIGAGSATTCQAGPLFDVDQRGVSRAAPTRGACDIGAYDTGGN